MKERTYWRYDVALPLDPLADAKAAAKTLAQAASKLEALVKRLKAEAQAESLAELKARVDKVDPWKAPKAPQHVRAEYPGAARFRALVAERKAGKRGA